MKPRLQLFCTFQNSFLHNLQINLKSVKEIIARKKKSIIRDRIRTCNLLVRSQTRYPLRHTDVLLEMVESNVCVHLLYFSFWRHFWGPYCTLVHNRFHQEMAPKGEQVNKRLTTAMDNFKKSYQLKQKFGY